MKNTINWKHLPDPILESEVKLELTWSADPRTQAAIERQAALMGFATPTNYLHQIIAAVVSGNEEDTFVLADGSVAQRSAPIGPAAIPWHAGRLIRP